MNSWNIKDDLSSISCKSFIIPVFPSNPVDFSKECTTNYGTKENKQNLEEKEKKIFYENNEVRKNDKLIDSIDLDKKKEFINIVINNNEITTKEVIIEIFDKKGENFSKYKNNLINNNISSNVLQSLRKIKTKKKKNKEMKSIGINEIKVELKRGRKKKGDNSERYHNKESPDNIIKKVKKNLLLSLVISINKILKRNGYNEDELYKLNYKELVNKTDKKFNIQLLGMPIKELLSMKISGKYKTKSHSPYKNQEYIEQILKKNGNDVIIKYIFNISFRDWIDIFTLKRESSIKNAKFEGIDSLLEEIYKDNSYDNDNYFCNFVFYLYNYERYWLCKRDRKENKNVTK